MPETGSGKTERRQQDAEQGRFRRSPTRCADRAEQTSSFAVTRGGRP